MLGGLGRLLSVKSVSGAYAALPAPMSGEPAVGVKSVGAEVNMGFDVMCVVAS